MDHRLTPAAIRSTLLDVLDFCNRDFRPHYRRTARKILNRLEGTSVDTIVELGAGTAPITQALSADSKSAELTLIPSDLYPVPSVWRRLQKDHPQQIRPEYASVDFTVPHDWGNNVAIVLSATLHHIPAPQRLQTLRALARSADLVLIFEPVQKNPVSMFLVLFAIIPALLTPLFRLLRPGRLRRILWCWLIPVAPLMFVWDGLVSCLRQWNRAEWQTAAHELETDSIQCVAYLHLHSATIILKPTGNHNLHN
jgi:hypothetical protein